MRQVIPFKKDITFKSTIGELTSISLDHDLQLKGEDLIVGSFYIKGKYKLTKASQIEEDYSYKIPCEVAISNDYDTYDAIIDIDDFYYEIKQDDVLEVNITVSIDNLVKKEKKELIEQIIEEDKIEEEDKKEETIVRNIEKDIDEIERDEIINPIEMLQETKKEVFNNTDTYSCYYVYLVQEEDTLEKIMTKYNITREQLSFYNAITDIKSGMKLVIPEIK